MDVKQKRQLEAARRAHRFVSWLPADLPDGVLTPLNDELAQIIARLNEHALEQGVGTRIARAATQQRRRQAATLVQRMRTVALLARKHLRGTAGVDQLLVRPSGNIDLEGLVQAGLAMAKAAEPHASLFTASGLKADFIDRLREAAQAVADITADGSQTRARVVGARKAVKEELTRAREVIAALDTIIKPGLGNDPLSLGAWQNAKRAVLTPSGSAAAAPAEPEKHTAAA